MVAHKQFAHCYITASRMSQCYYIKISLSFSTKFALIFVNDGCNSEWKASAKRQHNTSIQPAIKTMDLCVLANKTYTKNDNQNRMHSHPVHNVHWTVVIIRLKCKTKDLIIFGITKMSIREWRINFLTHTFLLNRYFPIWTYTKFHPEPWYP